MTVRLQALVVGAVWTLAVPLAAQQAPATNPEAELKSQMSNFEAVLNQQFINGAQRLAAWAKNVTPDVMLTAASSPTISGTPLPDGGLLFDIRVPEIVGVQLLEYYQQRPDGNGRVAVPAPPRNIGGAARQDPSMVSAAAKCDPNDPVNVNGNEQYRECIRQSFVEAMLNSAGLLTIEDGRWLSVAVAGIDPGVINPLYPSRSRKLVISIKGEDLQALRARKIDKDTARQRIVQRWF